MKRKHITPAIGILFMVLAFANFWMCPNGATWLLSRLPPAILSHLPKLTMWLNEQAVTTSYMCWLDSIAAGFLGSALLYGSK